MNPCRFIGLRKIKHPKRRRRVKVQERASFRSNFKLRIGFKSDIVAFVNEQYVAARAVNLRRAVGRKELDLSFAALVHVVRLFVTRFDVQIFFLQKFEKVAHDTTAQMRVGFRYNGNQHLMLVRN